MTPTAPLEVLFSVLSKAGGRSMNEDACGYWTSDHACCCVVSDGLGGYLGGQIASQLTVSTLLQSFASRQSPDASNLMSLLDTANQALLEKKREDPRLLEMRATVVMLALDFVQGMGNWAHLGDSRLYLFRHGRVEARTSDHSYIQNMADQGQVGEDEIRRHPMRNLLLGALGSVDEFTPTVQEAARPFLAGDAVLLCSDGFWQYLEDREMLDSLNLATTPGNWLETMEALLLTRASKGHDNYSALAMWLRANAADTATQPLSTTAAAGGLLDDLEGTNDSPWATTTLPLK